MSKTSFQDLTLTQRQCALRNAAIAVANGMLTLVILLIAPLGLAAVIVNTVLVALSSWVVAGASDRLMAWLNASDRQEVVAGAHLGSDARLRNASDALADRNDPDSGDIAPR